MIKPIDISKIIKEGDSVLLKRLPSFIVKWIARVVREEDLNQLLIKYKDYNGIDFLPKVIEDLNLTLEITGKENLPDDGKCFFAANHPFGILDGLILTYIVSQKYGRLKAIGNDAFMFIPQLRPLIATVNVFGRSSKEYIQALEATYNSDVPITHFPAGIVSRKYHGKVQDSDWQKSFITKSISSKRNIVPFYFYGKNSRLFYTIFVVRKFLGIKLNLELMLLPRELFIKRNQTIKIRIGKPISHQIFDKSINHYNWAQKVRAMVHEMEK